MAAERGHQTHFHTIRETDEWPILICLFGGFRLLKVGQPVAVRGGKTETLLTSLALRYEEGLPRETLLEAVWPNSDPGLAGQSLNSLVYSLHKLLGDALDGAAPVLHLDGCYGLNREAGVGVDVACFEALARAGEQRARAGDEAGAATSYARAVDLYRSDLCAGTDIHAVVERERLRALYLMLLARLATHSYTAGDYAGCLAYALKLLQTDPCREDAHRLVMRCYVRRGERAQALRHYRLCETLLRKEFDARPEPATTALFDQVRLDPSSV